MRHRPAPRAKRGASAAGANLAAAASPISAPRSGAETAALAGARVTATSAHTTSIDTIASFEFDSIANRLYGYDAHAYASTIPSALPPGPGRARRPSTSSPSIVSRSNAIAAACAAGRSGSQRPLQPSARSNGTYAR